MSMQVKRKSNEETVEVQGNNKKVFIEKSLEEKISKLVTAVLSNGPFGALVVILHSETEHPYVTLQNSFACLNGIVSVIREDNTDNFELQINGEVFVKGNCQNMQVAKKTLGEQALEKLKDMCFFIQKKSDYVNVTKENLQASTSNVSGNIVAETNSAAHKMMLKMGWTGGGLGAQEQGRLDTVTLYENVDRKGLGSHTLMKEITKKLENFSKSSDLLTLVFNADFSKEERALIHRVARKFNLKSKSSGTECRKLTVSKKLTRMDIVQELLRIGGEDGLYSLQIPRKFRHLWTEEQKN